MATPEQAAASAAWLAQEHPDWTQANTAAQAAAINAAYRSNTLPVTPQYAAGGGAKYTAAEIADAANEAAKYQYFNAPINYAAYANVPLSQMPANIASRVQDYYAAHPSAAAQAITSQYAAAKSGVINTGESTYQQGSLKTNVLAGEGGFTGNAAEYAKNWIPLSTTLDATNTRASQQGQKGIDYASVSGLANPFNPASAAGIMWDVARTGGTVGKSVSDIAAAPIPEIGYKGYELPSSWVSSNIERSTVPVSVLDTSKWFAGAAGGAAIPGQDMYFRIGDTGKTQLKENAKMIYAESGAFNLLQVVPSNLPGSNFTRIYPWITAGGSDNALQGSAVTGKPLVTIEGKQSNALVYDQYGLNRVWDSGTMEGSVANRILAGIDTYSKAGRELYGGTVQPTDARTIQSEFLKGNLIMPGVYSPAIQSYANLVSVSAENMAKGTIASEANLPTFGEIGARQFASMPPVQQVNLKGEVSPVYASFIPIESQVPAPFKSESKPSSLLPLGNTGTYVTSIEKIGSVPAATPQKETPKVETTPVSDFVNINSGIAGIIGSKTGLSTAATNASSWASSALSGIVSDVSSKADITNQPGAKLIAPYIGLNTTGNQPAVNKTPSVSESTIFGGSNQTIKDLRSSIDIENQTLSNMFGDLSKQTIGNVTGTKWTGSESGYSKYVSDVEKYNSASDALKANVSLYNAMDIQNPNTKTVITTTSGVSETTAPVDQFPGLTWLQKAYENAPLKMAVGGFVGAGSYGYAAAPSAGALGEIGAAAFGGESATAGVLASNPVGWGAGIGIGAVMLAERSGYLGLTGETAGASVRSAGAYTAQQLYNAGFAYQGRINSDLQTLGEMGGNVVNLISNNNPLSRIGGGGAGGRGGTVNVMNVGNPFAGSELPNTPVSKAELPAQANAYTEIPNRASAFTELPATLPAYKEVSQTGREQYNILDQITKTPTQEQNKNQNPNDYANRIAEVTDRGFGYPVGTPTGEPSSYRNPTGIGIPYSYPNPVKTPTNTPTRYTTETPTTNPYKIITDTSQRYETNTNNPDTPPPPKIETPKIIIPTLGGGFGGGGGGSSTGVKGGFTRAYTNRFLYGQGVGTLDFAGVGNFAKRSTKRSPSTGKINFRGRGR